ncbi:putative reverse transcriptase domain-containing protein [Tanacetum coccineum]|uniref:Reverse transcriptase domain-containing protein n=1 Tax=Tanacetum coccineum TaxID=301880 RepID=A0ABQ4XTX6_9ASTR
MLRIANMDLVMSDGKMEGKGAAMAKLVEKLGNTKDKIECKKLKKELEEARIMPPRYAHLTQAVISRMIKESVDATIVAEQARHTNVGNDSTGSGPARGQDAAPAARECTFAGFMKGQKVKFAAVTQKKNAWTAFDWWNAKVTPMGLAFMKPNALDVDDATRLFNELALMCPRMVEPERVIVDAYIRGLTNNIKGEVTSSKPANLNEAVRMAHKLMEQKSQARDERILEGKKRKWENYQSGNSSGKCNHKDNSRQTLQNNQKQGNVRAMVIAPTKGKVSSGSLPLCERFFTHHVGLCTIKCHKCRKIGHKARFCKEKNVAMGANALPILTCYDCGEQGFDRSFVDTRFRSMLNIDPVKIRASYEVKLADGRVVSTNTILKACTLNLVNHIFEIDLIPIELGTFDVIIGMDWLVKHDVVIVYGEKVVRIPYGDKMLIVESDKGVSRLKVISCINALLGAAPVASYRLAPSEMRELSVQLQELLEKGFIRLSSSP